MSDIINFVVFTIILLSFVPYIYIYNTKHKTNNTCDICIHIKSVQCTNTAYYNVKYQQKLINLCHCPS